MDKFELAIKIYNQIAASLKQIEEEHNIFCALPPFIELDGVIYQHYQCVDDETWLKFSLQGAQQLKDVMDGRVRFYSDGIRESIEE
jgi:hypothetical protein